MIQVLVATYGSKEWGERGEAAAVATPGAQPYHIPHGTLAEARNWAAAKAEEDWLVYLDADDRLGPRYVEKMEEAIRARGGEPGLYVPRLSLGGKAATWPNRSFNMREVNHCCIGTCFRREDLVAVGGWREWPAYEDWDLFLRMHLELRRPLVYVDAVYEATYSPTGRNSQEPAVLQAAYEGIRKANGLA